MLSCPLGSLKMQHGENTTALYHWNTHTTRHYFWEMHGIFTRHNRVADPWFHGIHIGCFDGVDLAAFQDVLVANSVSLALVNQ